MSVAGQSTRLAVHHEEVAAGGFCVAAHVKRCKDAVAQYVAFASPVVPARDVRIVELRAE